MKRLYVLRHAQAGSYTPTDHERGLTDFGVRQALSIASKISGVDFGYAIVSDAERTQRTFSALEVNVDVLISDEAYNASALQLEALVRNTPAHVENVLLIAHNPGVSDMARVAGVTQSLGTCDLVVVEFDSEWDNFAMELSRVVELVHPDRE